MTTQKPEADAHDLVFRQAVAALDAGDVPVLQRLLQENPSVTAYRCGSGEWYEVGYFREAMLLHHVAGNPIRCPLPAAILDVARLLLEHGADPNAATGDGCTTIGLLLTSRQASEAGVALPLIDLLIAAGASDDITGPDVLMQPLLNCARATAEELVNRGVPMDLRHAAGLGRLDALEAMVADGTNETNREEALVFACVQGQEDSARLLSRHGARGDVLIAIGGQTPRTALHEAANRGHLPIVQLLLANGADSSVIEPRWGGTPSGWAKHGGHFDIATLLDERRE